MRRATALPRNFALFVRVHRRKSSILDHGFYPLDPMLQGIRRLRVCRAGLVECGLSATRHMLRFYTAVAQPDADIVKIFSQTVVASGVHRQTFKGTPAAINRPVGEADN